MEGRAGAGGTGYLSGREGSAIRMSLAEQLAGMGWTPKGVSCPLSCPCGGSGGQVFGMRAVGANVAVSVCLGFADCFWGGGGLSSGPSQPFLLLLLPQALCSLGPGRWGPLPSRCRLRAPHPAAASECGGCPVPSQGSCGRRGGAETVPPPPRLPGLGCPLCSPLGRPAAQSLAPAHIPVVMLWVSGLELVSVRGTEFSQD